MLALALCLVGLLLLGLGIGFAARPSKADPEFPEHPRRDWPVVLGLALGGLVALYLGAWLGRWRRGRRAPYGLLGRLVCAALAAYLLWLAVAEAVVRPHADAEARSARAPGTVVALATTAGFRDRLDVTVRFTAGDGRVYETLTRSMPVPHTDPPAVDVGKPWPVDAVRYNPAAPGGGSASLRDYHVQWLDVGGLLALAALLGVGAT
jgi:hypothetical protein